MSRILDNLEQRTENYIFPFFWQHGEDEAKLREYMQVIYNANIRAVCVEARPHPDFVGEKWWQDMDVILDEAGKRGMKVWILDDAHFPTGMAAGKMEDADPKLCKQYLNYRKADVCGPQPQSVLEVEKMAKTYKSPFDGEARSMFGSTKKREFDDDKLCAVVAAKLDGCAEGDINHLSEELVDLMPYVQDGVLTWDVPAGMWRIFVLYTTRNGGGATNYINMLSKRSCRMQIDAVYEPHYAHYKAYFGNTIAGFFSDEPAVGNIDGFATDNQVGWKDMPLPWSEEVPELLQKRLGTDYVNQLVALWNHVGSKDFTAKIRMNYMDCITLLIQKDFGEQLGDWCRAHGVEYIGHIVEDDNASEKLGASMGHYYRALMGQDMAGIDDIGGQITRGGENVGHLAFMGQIKDGEFFHHVLGKLGSSLGHIDPKKKGRCMCEAFGAYGWEEGMRTMKYIADHLLVRGVNQFVPHAFSPREFPDFDCPPHFYANGENPLYRPFGELMLYMNRMCHVLNGGIHVAKVALLYHAEAEWSGGDYMLVQKPARVLAENQIDFDIIPADVFADMHSPVNAQAFAASFDGKIHINGETYEALVIPESEYITKELAEFLKEAVKTAFPVICLNSLPRCLREDEAAQYITILEKEALCGYLKEQKITDILVQEPFPALRYYHYEQQNETYYMLSNESMCEVFEQKLYFPMKECPYLYKAFENTIETVPFSEKEDGVEVSIRLEPYESVVVLFSKEDFTAKAQPYRKLPQKDRILEGTWKVSFCENKEYPNFGEAMEMEAACFNINRIKPDFSGIVRYEKSVSMKAAEYAILEIEDAYESAELWVNGTYAGMRICPPYRFDISGMLRENENDIRIEVATTLARKVHAITHGESIFGPSFEVAAPSGIIGNVHIATDS